MCIRDSLKAEQLKLKKKILLSIRDKFTLSQVEDDLITNGTIDETFFNVINKVIDIKDGSSFFLTLPNLNAGNALIVGVNEILQKTNKKIFNYLIDFLYSFESSSNLLNDHGASEQKNQIIFQKSLIFLSNDLELFNEFLKRVTTLRSKNILDEFLSQFDMNPANSKPIMLSAHDPIRYIGDVLASVHSIIANEADFVKSLFNFQDENLKTSEEFRSEFSAIDIKDFNSNQLVLFLETLTQNGHSTEKPKDFDWAKAPVASKVLLDIYQDKIVKSQNAEVVFKMYKFQIFARLQQTYKDLAAWLGTVGRMKFVRPGYRLLNSVDRPLALATFDKFKDTYHPICKALVKQDLGLWKEASVHKHSNK